MSRVTNRFIVGLTLAGVAVVLGYCVVGWQYLMPTNDRDNRDNDKQREMMRIALKCGQLAPIPRGARIRFVRTEGNMFTRSFRLMFSADANMTAKWLGDSTGVRSATVIKNGGTTTYVLKPTCGYQRAEVSVDRKAHSVTVYVSKS